MSEEVWKDIAGYEGLYAVSSHGRVRSLVTDANRRARVLKTNNGGRYHHFSMCDGLGNRADAMPHRLVAQAFIPNPKGLPCVNHKDGNRGNNRADNLEWVTYAQNSQHSIAIGLQPPRRGSMAGNAKLDEAQVIAIWALIRAGKRPSAIGRLFGVCASNVSAIAKGKSWRHLRIAA